MTRKRPNLRNDLFSSSTEPTPVKEEIKSVRADDKSIFTRCSYCNKKIGFSSSESIDEIDIIENYMDSSTVEKVSSAGLKLRNKKECTVLCACISSDDLVTNSDEYKLDDVLGFVLNQNANSFEKVDSVTDKGQINEKTVFQKKTMIRKVVRVNLLLNNYMSYMKIVSLI
ncbi:hypothetical protein EDEG_01343 [Edhazardia aedis USNM 41457]|uniref:Uncharacterized protein n=1 Tax=Edhazardia aedis (strain USNM 41457) TaxID=1003232 RepID=J8ZXQ7_EDHAE|nr:hypothetical protein EDEG_01343 [Edhazardia aedis USNM 41457]|eukprot:EJW04473.1 hypothetical protein EDEG_01343 [Edhazardia aedis USNM 41457]